MANLRQPSCDKTLAWDESFFIDFFDSFADAVFAIDLDSQRIVQWNAGAERVFGYQAAKALGQTPDFVHADTANLDHFQATVLPKTRERGIWCGHWNCRRSDGSSFPAEVVVFGTQPPSSASMQAVVCLRDIDKPLPDGGRLGLLSNPEISRQISRRREEPISTFAHIAEPDFDFGITAEHFRLLIEGIKDYAILLLDLDGRIFTWNSGARQIFGYQAREILGNNFSVLLAVAEDPYQTGRQLLVQAKAEGSVGARLELLRKDQSLIHADVIITPICDTAGNHANFSMIIRDISERLELRQKLREKEYLATVGTTASIFAHEISNPLNSIATTIQVLERTLARGEFSGKTSALSSLGDLKNEISRLRSLLDDFKTLARPTTLDFKPVDIVGLVGQLKKMLAANFTQANIECTADVPESLPLVNGDADKLKQALLNLLKNAMEAMPKGGTITIKACGSGPSVLLEISDTGTGIPEGIRIFDLYQTSKPQGSGLGLVIVKQIITAHGGSISYSSETGVGTMFQINLPALHAPPDAKTQSPSRSSD